MAGVRVTIGGIGGKYPSRTSGDPTAIAVNTFGLKKLADSIDGNRLAEILLEALKPAYEQAVEEWPRQTGASGDSIAVAVVEVGPKLARVALTAGGEQLINDPRNKSHKDYAPFIEYNGTSTVAPGILTHAVYSNDPTAVIHEKVSQLINGLIR